MGKTVDIHGSIESDKISHNLVQNCMIPILIPEVNWHCHGEEGNSKKQLRKVPVNSNK